MDGSLNVENWLVVGNGPDRRLCDRFKWFNEVIEDMLGGIGPERQLHERSRVSSPCMALIFSGIYLSNQLVLGQIQGTQGREICDLFWALSPNVVA